MIEYIVKADDPVVDFTAVGFRCLVGLHFRCCGIADTIERFCISRGRKVLHIEGIQNSRFVIEAERDRLVQPVFIRELHRGIGLITVLWRTVDAFHILHQRLLQGDAVRQADIDILTLSGRGIDVNASDQAFRHWLCRGVRIGNIDGNLVSVLFKAFAL